MRSILQAELTWVTSVVEDLETGRLTWNVEWLSQVAAQFEQGESGEVEYRRSRIMTVNNAKLQQPEPKAAKPYKGMAMEGPIAKWYAKIRNNDPHHQQICHQINAIVPSGGRILEVAPGPGYLAIELAQIGKYDVVGLDISQSFVEIAEANANDAGVTVDFQQGNASAMPFDADPFDFVVCVAAFKNFTEPVHAIREMYRVLKPGGMALITDFRGDASPADITAMVDSMNINAVNKLLTRGAFKFMLLKNAYTATEIEQFAAQTEFLHARIDQSLVSMDIWLEQGAGGLRLAGAVAVLLEAIFVLPP